MSQPSAAFAVLALAAPKAVARTAAIANFPFAMGVPPLKQVDAEARRGATGGSVGKRDGGTRVFRWNVEEGFWARYLSSK
jgi:hypothetical protein